MKELPGDKLSEHGRVLKELETWKSLVESYITGFMGPYQESVNPPLPAVHRDDAAASLNILLTMARAIALDPNQSSAAKALLEQGKALAYAETRAIEAYEDWVDAYGGKRAMPGWTQLSDKQRQIWIQLHIDAAAK